MKLTSRVVVDHSFSKTTSCRGQLELCHMSVDPGTCCRSWQQHHPDVGSTVLTLSIHSRCGARHHTSGATSWMIKMRSSLKSQPCKGSCLKPHTCRLMATGCLPCSTNKTSKMCATCIAECFASYCLLQARLLMQGAMQHVLSMVTHHWKFIRHAQ